MHSIHIAHLDISLRNVLTDYHGHYRYIDFELSRRYEDVSVGKEPRITGGRGTEIPPELERGEDSDPFKVDVWALAILILRASQVSVPASAYLVTCWLLRQSEHYSLPPH